MKSIVKLSVSFAIFFIFALCKLNAQKATLPNLLIGEWTKLAQSGTKINDTIFLTRNLSEATEDRPRYKFELPDRLSRYFYKKSNSGVIALGQSVRWNYDENARLLRIFSKNEESYFTIETEDNQTIRLICVKKGS